MSEREIREYAAERGFHPRTLARWLGWEQGDSEALYLLAIGLKIGENHLRDLMDWLEEIALRDGLQLREILAHKTIADIESDPRLGRADKLKRIKEDIRRRRFPRLAQTEDLIRARVQELKLQPEIRMSVPPGLEGGCLRVEFEASSQEELKRAVAKLNDASGKETVDAIFRLLEGEPFEGEEGRGKTK